MQMLHVFLERQGAELLLALLGQQFFSEVYPVAVFIV